MAVCRELTKKFEQVVRGSAAELAELFAEPPRGEVTVVFAPGEEAPVSAAETAAALAAIAALVAAATPRKLAVEVVSGLTGLARNALYRDSV